jgi:hypothetical protein
VAKVWLRDLTIGHARLATQICAENPMVGFRKLAALAAEQPSLSIPCTAAWLHHYPVSSLHMWGGTQPGTKDGNGKLFARIPCEKFRDIHVLPGEHSRKVCYTGMGPSGRWVGGWVGEGA